MNRNLILFILVFVILLTAGTSCSGKDDSIYGNDSDHYKEQTDTDKTEANQNDKDEIKNDEDRVTDEKQDLDSVDKDIIDENIEDNEINDLDFEENDEEIDNVPDEDTIPITNINTGTKYIVYSEDIANEYQKNCFDYVKLARLISVHCETPDKIDLETPSGKCYVPYYMTGNAPKQATSSCAINIKLDGIEGSIKQGIHESNPEAFSNKVTLLIKNLMYLYLTHEYVLDENIRQIATYPYDGMSEQYKIPEYVNNFEFGGVPYKMLNEHLEVLHEMEFINTNNNVHTRFRLYPNNFKELGNYPFFVLDLLKCPELDKKELSLAVLGFLPNKNYENDTKYLKYLNGECDSVYEQRTQELINEIEGN